MNGFRRTSTDMTKATARSRSRLGLTLIELILVLSMVGALLGGAISLLALTQKSSQKGQSNFVARQEVRRFADDVRRDMHMAETADLTKTELVLKVQSPSSEIVYRVDDGELVRTASDGGDGAPTSHDRYVLASDEQIDVSWVKEGELVQWSFTSADGPRRPVRIIAARRSR